VKVELETELLRLVGAGQRPRDVAEQWCAEGRIANSKQMWATLDKWRRNGWYEYGVTLDLGWLTAAGKAHLATLGES
jgi:hypothetical protein